MIADSPDDITAAALAASDRAPDARFREVMRLAVAHLHAFVREAALTEAEFRRACAFIAELGQRTTPSHNEVVLMAGSLGVSALVCALDHASATSANLMGPFWRDGAPPMRSGDSIVRSPTAGDPLFVTLRVEDLDGRPVADARVDVWQAAADGRYENQDPSQAEMNLRGTFRTDAEGRIDFRSVRPSGYPVPVDGPVGALLRAQGRHNLRPAHLHAMVHKPGFRTLFAQVYADDDPNLESDVQFGVRRPLVGRFRRHAPGVAAPARDVVGTWWSLDHRLVIEPGEATLPRAPVSAKATERSAAVVLEPRR
ncbi:MAG TPA: dioxygenase [Caldimonas sp.]|nr:dioxygenase [Caldimonas sp.]